MSAGGVVQRNLVDGMDEDTSGEGDIHHISCLRLS